MKFISTRDKTLAVSSAEAIVRGIAPDGGLFLPEEMPRFTLSEISAMRDMPFPALSAFVLSRFLPDYTEEELRSYTQKAYASFAAEDVIPVKPLGDGTFVMELFHGPTCAFKDVALQILPYLMAAGARKCGNDNTIAILVATSGDTGKAALAGFDDVPGTKIGVFYPDGGVSAVQRMQMVTQEGDNVFVSAVRGNFDDCQTAVKSIFGDRELRSRLLRSKVELSSANSINWGRLAPQIAYYFHAYARLLARGVIRAGDRISFCVPTGNFGDILAGYFAKRSGLPVDKLVCASNSNDVLTDFLRTGVYDRNRSFRLTMSPSMDILISSNLERLLFLLSEDDGWVRERMAELKEKGRYDVGGELLRRLHEEGFVGCCADEEQTAAAIRRTWTERQYAADPHTAVGLCAVEQYRRESGDHGSMVALSTASPFKFATAMLSSLGVGVSGSGFDDLRALSACLGTPAPAPLGELEKKKVRFPGVVEPDAMSNAVEEWLVKA